LAWVRVGVGGGEGHKVRGGDTVASMVRDKTRRRVRHANRPSRAGLGCTMDNTSPRARGHDSCVRKLSPLRGGDARRESGATRRGVSISKRVGAARGVVVGGGCEGFLKVGVGVGVGGCSRRNKSKNKG
jgi:hypothetical protein